MGDRCILPILQPTQPTGLKEMNRRKFIASTSLLGAGVCIGGRLSASELLPAQGIEIQVPQLAEGVLGYLNRIHGGFDIDLYRQILGAANAFKEGDAALGVAANDNTSRTHARTLLLNTKIEEIDEHPVFEDGILSLIQEQRDERVYGYIKHWPIEDLRSFVLERNEEEIKAIMPGLSSDVIACLVKTMSNDQLIAASKRVFNPLPNSNIGAKGYMGARVQPNSPTDNIDDIVWQVFCAWSYAVGDVVLGTNPVSSTPESVARVEKALHDIVTTFGLEEVIPNCVLSHIDVQAKVEERHPGTTGVWFQSLAGTESANKTFDLTIQKMERYASLRKGPYGLYAETGQGADQTNGHAEGFDMVMHESRKYGFLKSLKARIEAVKGKEAWVHVNDVAGFIGPEVFKNREQLVRCCLEDILMGKLHGLTIGLDICSTLHMDIALDDLDWCIDQIMPANPAYLMALPTKNDPMLSYLSTAVNNHVAVREKFGYKVNDKMWEFFQRIGIVTRSGKPTDHFGDPIWVYYQYLKAKRTALSKKEVYEKGEKILAEIKERGVPIARGYGDKIWDLEPELDAKVRALYDDAKVSLWTEMPTSFAKTLPNTILVKTQSLDRKDYVYHPGSGEKLSEKAEMEVRRMAARWGRFVPDIQLVISDGLNARAIMDTEHLRPYLIALSRKIKAKGLRLSEEILVMKNGRVRAGYQCGHLLFGHKKIMDEPRVLIHVIGERPGTGHHNFSAYISVATGIQWAANRVDHDITKVVSGISDTALKPSDAAIETMNLLVGLI